MLVYFALGDANFLRRPCTFHFLCVDFFALGSKRKPNSQWNIGGVGCLALGLCVGHIHSMCQVTQTLPNAIPLFGGIWALPVSCISVYFTLQFGVLSPGAKGLKWTFFCHKSKLGHKL